MTITQDGEVLGSGEGGEVTLTRAQRRVLRALNDLRLQRPHSSYGFNPSSFGGGYAAKIARGVEGAKLVKVNRISETHFRYAISDEGVAALSQAESREP